MAGTSPHPFTENLSAGHPGGRNEALIVLPGLSEPDLRLVLDVVAQTVDDGSGYSISLTTIVAAVRKRFPSASIHIIRAAVAVLMMSGRLNGTLFERPFGPHCVQDPFGDGIYRPWVPTDTEEVR